MEVFVLAGASSRRAQQGVHRRRSYVAEIIKAGLAQEVRSFGWRVFDLADRLSGVDDDLRASLCKAVAAASRHLAKRARALEPRVTRRETEKAFQCLSDAVGLLDRLCLVAGDLSVDASSLAAEATGLAEQVYELCEVC